MKLLRKMTGSNPFAFLVLTVWTLLLAAYTWWMLRSPFPRPVPVPMLPPTPTELAVGPVVTHDTMTLEGLLTWTYARVLGQACKSNSRQTTMEESESTLTVTGIGFRNALYRTFAWLHQLKVRAHTNFTHR